MKLDLFAYRFKGHKRCAHMIASSLAGDDTLTAAQVSRKLKQLGLHVHQQKITEGNMHLRDEDLNDSVGKIRISFPQINKYYYSYK